MSARPPITDALLSTVRTARPRLLITDIRMPPGQTDEGLRAAGVLRAEQPDLSVLVLSQHVQASAAADLLTGQTSGIGYLLKERVTALDEFLAAARTVAGGGTVIDPLITQELLSRRRTAIVPGTGRSGKRRAGADGPGLVQLGDRRAAQSVRAHGRIARALDHDQTRPLGRPGR